MDKRQEKPSNFNGIYWLIQDKKIEPAVLFSLLSLFWPEFIQKDGFVFLKETYAEEYYFRLVNEKSNPEYWINLLTVDDFFSEKDDWEEQSASFAKVLVEIWEAKLKNDFPSIHFVVKYLCDKECGDYGLTFYQVKE